MQLTAKQVADYYGVRERTVTNWVNSDPPCPSILDGSRRFFDSATVAAWKEQRAVDAAISRANPVDFEEAKGRKMAAEAELTELELARVRGESVPVALFAEKVRDLATKIRSQLLAAPGRYSARVVGIATLPAAQQQLDAIVRDVLNELKEA
jgi:phage terminase Nu1 subunit (DNA packaging protein)